MSQSAHPAPQLTVASQSRSGALVDLSIGTPCMSERLRLVTCPACGADFSAAVGKHGANPLDDHLLYEHGPADLGLEPLDESLQQLTRGGDR